MKKIYLLILLALAHLGIANNVSPEKAKTVGLNFLQAAQSSSVNRNIIADVNLLLTENVNTGSGLEAAYYIFAGDNNKGFVIVSGDDAVKPILGYSTESSVNINNLPPAFRKWMENNKKQIVYAKTHSTSATPEITTMWDNYFTNTFVSDNSRSSNSVNPLCTTTWDQQPYYNEGCPYDAANTTNQHAVTGCPATAMAQIMKFWNYPAQGSGIHSYNHATYGTLSANYGATTYNWASMPNNISSSNADIAQLMFQCGVSVEMNYGPNESSGWVITSDNAVSCQNAYTTYFGYDPATIQGLKRSDYADPAWLTLLTTELNAGRPIQYAGFGSGGGHTFVCDGYDANTNFHMNWGWSGYYDGYFAIDALNPGGTGTGGGTGGFNSGQEALIGIKPITGGGTNTGSIQMYSAITITPNPINFAQAFTVNADVRNAGSTSFSGDYCAALFNSAGDFINYIQTLTTGSNPLAPTYHYTGGLTFSSAGMLTVPGSYIVGIYYRPTGGNWYLAGANGYINPVNINIAGPANVIKLNSNIVPTPAAFVQGQAASVNVNIINSGSTTFLGNYAAALYDLDSGNLVQTIGILNETNGLQAGYTYNSPYLTFNSAAITAAPGSYILAILEQPTSGTWTLCGGDLFTNPVNITVAAPAVLPDIFEPDNTELTPHTLPLTFSGNTAVKNTSGSNIHIGSDVDFYKINLPAGYTYQITARAQDVYSSNDGNTYTVDVLFSYNTGSSWSTAYDDVLPGTINVSGGTSVIFQVAPYFPGSLGTYRLDLSVVRAAVTGIQESASNNSAVVFYPNPADKTITFKLNQSSDKIIKIDIYDALGALVKSQPDYENNLIDISNFPAGIYFTVVSTDKEILKSKFNVVK